MIRALYRTIATAAITAGLLVTTASAATPTTSFTAVFHERVCANTPAGPRFCGTGVIDRYGPVTTKTLLSVPTPGPEPGCQTFKGTRTATLTKDRRSTLRFAVQGPGCGTQTWGTFRIVSGTGIFAHASGSGVIWGTFSGVTLLTHYYGVIRLSQ